MEELITLIIIGLALSMDSFSMALAIGTHNLSRKKSLFLCINVGIMHFIMPIIGISLGLKLAMLFAINGELIFCIILIFLAINMFIESRKEEQKKFKLTILGIYLFAFGVSIDSFTTGIGLASITSNILLAVCTFSFLSFSFTNLGLTIGKYASKKLGSRATLLGAILLIIFAVLHMI